MLSTNTTTQFAEFLYHTPAASIRARYTSAMVRKLGAACTSPSNLTLPTTATVERMKQIGHISARQCRANERTLTLDPQSTASTSRTPSAWSMDPGTMNEQ
jgi:hypothetical protein